MKTNIKKSMLALAMAVMLATPAFAAGEPANVKNVTAASKDDTTLTLKWDEAKDAFGNAVDHYRVYYGKASFQKSETTKYEAQVDTPTNATIYDLGGLTKGSIYYISVTAIDGQGTESAEFSIETSGTPGGAATQTGTTNTTTNDTVAPTVLNVIAADKNHVLVGFSEKIVLPATLPEAAFLITEQANAEKTLEVASAKMYDTDVTGKTVILRTMDQSKNTNYVLTASAAMKDATGNPIQSGNADSGVFLGSDKVSTIADDALKPAANTTTNSVTTPEDLLLDTTTPTSTNTTATPTTVTPTTTPPATDTIAPEDVRNFVLSFKEQMEKFMVVMNWEASLNTAKDLVDQIIYMSTDKGTTYDHGTSVGSTATNYDMTNLEGGKEYTFKITTKDGSGNESVGVVQSIRLPQTGFGAGFLILTSAYGANRMLKRRREKLLKSNQ